MNYKIVAKYIKEVQFQIPNPKTFFMLSKDISNYKINININSNQFKEKFIEVETMMSLNTVSTEDDKIKTKIIYSAIVELNKNIKEKKELEEIILIKVPSEIYSSLRKSFIFLFEMSGFKDIKIEETVDFQKLYLKNRIQ
jgi:preprotein translocase subunit SecB